MEVLAILSVLALPPHHGDSDLAKAIKLDDLFQYI